MFPEEDPRELILVVEDDAGSVESERHRLEGAGFAVLTAGSSASALDRLRGHRVDLILLHDRLAGGVDGLDAYLEWKALGFDRPAILAAGRDDGATAIRALRAGVRDLIVRSPEYLDDLPGAAGRALEAVRTERSPAESRRESDDCARSVLDSLSDQIAVLDESGTILAVNRAWRAFAEANGAIGTIGEGANYLRVCEAAEGESRAAATATAAAIRDVLAGRRASFEYEYDCHSPSERRWFVGRVTPIPQGGPGRVVVAHQNITARKDAEQQLRESERMLRQSQQMAHVGSWELDLDGCPDARPGVLRWSDECYRIFGYEPGQVAVTEDLFFRAVHADDRAAVHAAFDRSIRENHRPYAMEHRIVRPDGGERVVFEWGEWLTGPDGRPIRAVGTCQDITERKAVELALRASEDRLALTLEAAGLGTWDADLITGRRIWSPRQEELFGFAPGAFDGTREGQVARVHPEDRDGLERALVRSRETRRLYQHEYRIVLPCGAIRWIAGFGRNYFDETGKPVRIMGIAQDITDRKRAEEALRRYANRLEHLHELNLAILASRSPREIAEAALEHLARPVPYRTAGVAVYDFDRDEVEVIATSGLLREWHPPGTRFHEDFKARPEIDTLRRGRVSTEEELLNSGRTSPVIESLRLAGMQAFLLVPLRDGGCLVGSLFLVSERPAAFSADQIEVAREVADRLAIAIRQALLLEEVRSAKIRLETLSRQLIRAQEEEQRRIARELHDEIGQSLTAVKINLQAMGGGRGDVRGRVAESAAIVERLLRQVRGMALDLRPSLLDDLGLAAALRWYVRRQAERTGLKGRFVAEPDEFETDPEIGTACFRVAQEAVTNVARHAAASRFSVELFQHPGGLRLIVRDDGRGFDPDAAREAAFRGKSFGLAGMCERVELVGGKIAFASGSGAGTEIRADFPSVPAGPIGSRESGPQGPGLAEEA